MACNDLFGAGAGSQIGPTDTNRKYKLQTCEIAIVDSDIRQLLIDFDVMIQLTKVKKQQDKNIFEIYFEEYNI